MSNRRAIRCRIFTALTAFAIVLGTCLSATQAHATYSSDNAGNAQKLETIRTYYQAAKRCVQSSSAQSTSMELSSRSDYNNEYLKGYYNLDGAKLFANDNGRSSSNLLYSEFLEHYYGNVNSDGKIRCSEINIFPIILSELKIEHKSLVCNGKDPGILKITTGYGGQMFGPKYDNDKDGVLDWPAGWPDQNDCSGNLAKLLEYIEQRPRETVEGSGNGNHDYSFRIKLEIAPDALQHFVNVVDPVIGNYNDAAPNAEDSMNYWRYYQTFEIGCLGGIGKMGQGASIMPPAASSTNMLGVYDAISGNVYYYSTSDIHSSDKQYYAVNNSTQLTCKELAQKLGENIEQRAKDLNKASMEDCAAKYRSELSKFDTRIRDYESIQIYAKGFKTALENKVKEIKNGRFEPVQIGNMDEEPFNKSNYINTSLKGYWYEHIKAGIDNKIIYNDKLANNLITGMTDLLNNTVVDTNGETITEKPSDDAIAKFESLLSDWQTEIDRVQAEIDKAKQKQTNMSNNSSRSAEDLEGVAWTIEETKTGDKHNFTIKCIGLETIANEIDGIFSAAPPNIDTNWSPIPQDHPAENYVSDICLDQAGADSLSWMVCPAISGMANGSDGIFTLVKDLLNVEASFLATSGDGNQAYQIWGYFRDTANIIFVIFILAVIFSQVSGFGIDNYGIKKMLPRLIVAGILINISFFICQGAVDLSNILGSNFNIWLGSMAETALPGSTGMGPLSYVEAIFGAVATGIGAIGGTAIAVVTAGIALEWWLVLILVGIMLLIILVAIVAIFVMLAARKIIVIVAVAIAPVAIICYSLPNTEKLYKKWFDLFKAALLIFPICSLLSGAGQLIQAIVIGSSGTELGVSLAIVAALCPFIPFFALPSLLKGALAGVGNLGAAISGLRSKAQSGLQRGSALTRDTDAYKDAKRQTGIKFDTMRRDRLNKKLAKLGEGKKDTSRYQRLERRAGTLSKRISDAKSANSSEAGWADPNMLESMLQRAENKEHEEAVEAIMDLAKAKPNGAIITGRNADGSAITSNYVAEDGELLYKAMKFARQEGDHRRADAMMELAMKNGKASARFQSALLADKDKIHRETARRIMSSKNAGILKAVDGIAYQYAREADELYLSGRDADVGSGFDWATIDEAAIRAADSSLTDDQVRDRIAAAHANIKKSIEKNINSADAYASQSTDALGLLNAAKAGIMKIAASGNSPAGKSVIEELGRHAAAAIERGADTSKIDLYNAATEVLDPATGARRLDASGEVIHLQTREREAQIQQANAQIAASAAQTASITSAVTASSSAAATASAAQAAAISGQTAIIEDHNRIMQQQARTRFESDHTRTAVLNPRVGEFTPPAGYVPEVGSGHIFRDPSGVNRRYDAENNRFL